LFGADLERRRTGHEEVLAGLSSGDAIVSFAHYRHLKRSMVGGRAALDTSWRYTRSASENAVRRRAPGARVVHLATHGFFLADRCGASPTDSMAVLDPLLLSGLVFAGANVRHRAADPGDDGILTAEE